MSWLSDRWHDVWDPLSDALASFDDYAFNGGFEDDLRRLGRKFDEYIIEPIYDWQKGFVNGFLDNPIKALVQIVLMATGMGWVIPMMNTAQTVMLKALDFPGYEDVSWGDIAKGAAKQYATGKLLGGFGEKFQGYADLIPDSNFFLQDVLLDGLVDGFSASSTALVLGDSFSDAFLDPFLEASIPQLVGMGMGKVDELVDGLNFETIEGEFKRLPTIIQDTIAGGINAKLQGQDVTEDIFYEAVTNAIITSKAVSGVLETISPNSLDFLSSDSAVSNQYLAFLTGGVQNAVSSALSGGTGEQAAAHILGAIEAGGAAQLSDFFDESALGEMANKGVDWVVNAVDSGIRFAGDTFAVGVKMIQGSWQAHRDAIDALEAMATPEFLAALEEANDKQDELLSLHGGANEAIAGQQDLMEGIFELQEGGEFIMFATSAERDDYTMPWISAPRVYRRSYYTQEEYDAYVQANGTAPEARVGQEVYRQVVKTRRGDSGMALSDEDYAQWETDNAEWIAEKSDQISGSLNGYEYSDSFMTYLIHSYSREDPNVEGVHEISGLSDVVLVNPPSGTVAGRGDNYWNAELEGKVGINAHNRIRNDPYSMGGYYDPYGPGSNLTIDFAIGSVTASFEGLEDYANTVGSNAQATIDLFDDATAEYDTWAEEWNARTGFDATDITTYNELWNDVVTTQETLGLESDNFWNDFDDDIENINLTVAVAMDENFDSDWYFENYNMAETGGSFTRSEAAQHYLAVGSKQNYFTNQDAYVSAVQTGAISALSSENTLGGQIPAVYNPKAVPKVSDAAYNNQSFDLALLVNGLGLTNSGFVTDQGSIGATNAGSAAVQVNLNVNNADVAANILRSLNAGAFDWNVSASTEDINYLISGNGALNYGLRDIDGSLENLERTKDTLQALNGKQKHNANGSITTWNFSPDIASIDTLLDTYTSFNNDSAKDWNNADTVLGDGVTWEDVIDGNTKQTFDVATGTYVLESSIPTSTMWDSTTGSKDVAGNSLENQRYTDPNAYLSNVNSLFSGDFGATMEEIVVYADSNNVTYIPSEVRQLAAARAEALQNAKDDDSLSEPERREALFGLNDEYATVLNASAAVVKQYAGLKGYWERLTTSEGGAVDPELMARAEALETMATSYTTAELKAAREDMDKYIRNFGEFLKDPATGEFIVDGSGNKIRRDYYVNEEGLEGKELLSAQANNSMLMVLGSYRAAPTSFMYDMLLQEILESAPAIAAGTAAGAVVGAQWGKILGIPGTAVGTAVGAVGGFAYSTGARAYNIANNLVAKKAALGIGAGVDIAFAMGAAYEGQSDLVRQLVTQQYKAVKELSFITDPPSMVRKYSDEQVAEIADRKAATAGLESATRQGITLALLMGMGKLAAEEALLGTNTGQNKVFNSMWDAASDRVIDTTKIALKEGAAGGADEGLLALGDNIWINKNVDKDWELSQSAFDAMWAGIFIEGTIGAGTSLVGAGSGIYINTNSEVNKDSNGLNNDLSGTGASNVLMFNPLVSNAMEQIKEKQKLLEWTDETALNAATGFLGSIGVEYDNPAYSDFLNEIDDAAYNSSTEVADQFKILGYTPTQEEIANFTGAKFDLNMPLTTAVTQYAAPYVILASDVTAAAQAAGLQYATQADIRALSGAFAAGITKEDAIAGITTRMQDDKFTGEEFKAYLVSDHGFTEGQAEAYYNANKADIDSKLTLGTSSVIQEGFGNIFTDTGQFLEDNPVAPPPPVATAEELAIQQLDEVLSNKDTGAYRYFLEKIEESHAANGSAYLNAQWGGSSSLDQLLRNASKYELTRAQVEESFISEFGSLGVSREDSDFDAQVDAYISEQGITLGTNPTAWSSQPSLTGRYVSNTAALNNAAQAKWITTFQNILDDAGVTDFEVTASNANAFKGRTNPVEEFTTYAEQQKRNQDARIEASTTLSNGTAQAVLITRFGMSNMTWDAEQGKNVPNQEMADIIAKHFELGEGAEGSALERLNAGIDAYRTELMEDRYGITPTPAQLERLRSATDTQWINDPEILEARRDLAAANNAKTLSPMELAYYLAELDISYNSDDGIYRAIMGMGFTGEGGPDFDATQRAAIATEVTRLKEVYDAENDATQQLADTKQAFIDAGYTPTDSEVEQFLTNNAGIPDFITNTVKPRVEQEFIDAGYNPDAATVDAYLNNIAGIPAFVRGKRNNTKAAFGDYNPSEQEITDYLNNNAGIAAFVQGKRNDTKDAFGNYNPSEQEITDYLNNNANIDAFVQGKRNDTKDAFGDYTPTSQEITDYLNNNAGIAGYLAPKQYTRDEAIADLETELGRSLTQEEIDDGVYDTFLDGLVDMTGARTDAQGKTQVESDITNTADVRSYLDGLGYDTTGLSNEQLLAFAGTGLGVDLDTATAEYQADNETIEETADRLAEEEAARLAAEAEVQTVKDALAATGLTMPADFDYAGFYARSEGQPVFAWETGLPYAVDAYKKSRQYTRDEAIADLETELGRSLTQEEIDGGVYDSFLDGVVQLDGDTSADATGKTQVESDITSADDVKSYLEGLGYTPTEEEIAGFAGTGLDVDLGTVTSDYQADNETIEETTARLAAEAAELAAKTTAINAAMDDASQDGGAYSGVAYDGIRDYYLYNVDGKPQYDALDEEGRKALVQRAVDNRRYSESEIAADIRTAFPADADLSVEDLKTKYSTLFTDLQTEGNFGHEDNQRIAFDQGTITDQEVQDYFKDVLGYDGWMPTGSITSRIAGVGDESTVLPTDTANLTGETLALYNETTVTQDEVIGAMIANPAGFGFADAAAVAQAVSDGLDLSAYTGNYWQAGANPDQVIPQDKASGLLDRLDDATISQDEIDAYLAQEGFDPADAGTFDGNLGFDTTSLADITAGYRGGVEAERAAAAELQRQTAAINAALDDATQDGGAYTPGDRQGFIDWFVNNKNFEGKTAEEIKATIYDDIDNKRYTRSEVADDLRTAFPADAGLSIEDLEAKYAGAFDLVKTGAYATDGEQRTAFGAATTTETEARDALEATGFVIPDGFDFTNLIGVMDATQLGTQISTDLAPLQYTRADAEAALVAELGRPLTAEDLTTYKDYLDGLVDMTGARTDVQGNTKIQDEVTSEQEVRDYLSDYTLGEDFSFDGLTGLDVDLDTELGEFKADNRTTAQNQIAADLNTKGWADASDDDVAAVQGLDSAGRDAWVAERQFTEDQAIAALAAQGITADHPQFESLITQLVVDKGAAGTPTTQGALVDDPEDDLIDRYIITQDEIDTATGGYSYFDFTQTPLGIEPGVADDTTLAGLVQTHVGDNYVQADAAREALNGIAGVDAYEQDGDGAYVITDDQLVGMGLAGQYDPTTLGSKVDAATTTEEEVRAAFGENYDPTDAEIARYMGLLPDGDLGTDIPAYVAGRMDTLVSEVGDLALTVSQLEAQLNGALAEGGSLDQAVSKVADDLGIAEEALLKLIGDNSDKFDDLETAFGTQATDDQEATGIWANIAGLEDDVSDLQDAFGTQGVVDDPDTLDIDESSPATGVYGIIDQIANGSLDNEDAIAALEAVIGEPATYAEDGTTVLTPATGVYAQSGEGVNADVLEAINAVYAYVGNMDTVGSAELEAIGAIVGKPAQEVTQEDIDAVTSLVQGTAVDPETGIVSLYDAKYDVNNDGVVDTRDQDLLTAVQEGDYSVYGGELATDSLFSNTGFYDIFDETRYDTEIQRKQDQDIQNDINEEINNNININTNIFLDAQKKAEEEADKQEYARLMQQVQAMSQVSVETPQELANIEYMYDVYGNSPFANDQQRGLYQSPYARAKQDEMATQQQLPLRAAAEGGLIEDETDELMKLLGI